MGGGAPDRSQIRRDQYARAGRTQQNADGTRLPKSVLGTEGPIVFAEVSLRHEARLWAAGRLAAAQLPCARTNALCRGAAASTPRSRALTSHSEIRPCSIAQLPLSLRLLMAIR